MSLENGEAFLVQLGRRVRSRRLERGLSQQRVAMMAGLSLRYLSQLETGRGNISILRLAELAKVLETPLEELVKVDRTLSAIALVGLRGAGKSTVGRALAKALGREFHELDHLIEDEAGLGLGEIFALHGETYYRRLEREVLSRLLTRESSAVLATGGSLVTDRVTYELLKRGARTVWLKARPEQHLERVAAQGDRRPMAGRANPLAELRTLLREREPLYAQADLVVDTSRKTPKEVTRRIARWVQNGWEA